MQKSYDDKYDKNYDDNYGHFTILDIMDIIDIRDITRLYGRSRQCGRPVGAPCSMGLGRNPLINC